MEWNSQQGERNDDKGMLMQRLHGKPTTTLKIDTQHLKKDTQYLGQRKEGNRAAHRLESRREKGNDASQTKGH